MTLIASLVLGALIGEIINIEAAMERFGTWLRKISHSEGDGGFVGGFVNASLTVCVGAMAVVGSIQDGILGDHSTLEGGARPHHRYGDDRRKRQGLYFLGDTSGDLSGNDNRPIKAAGAGNDSACAR